jgi:UDP-N-acetylglucosamine 2-epimerase (non-hydrolysing)
MLDAPVLVLVGTKAQFIKTAPILREFDARGVTYRIVYTGQHSETFDLLEAAFETRPADEILVASFEASTNSSFLRWAFLFWREALARIISGRWRGAQYGLVHGDTASTLFAALALRLAGIRVAHVEAGLRSTRLLEPFPEEMVRRIVSHLSHIHFAPDENAACNLRGVRGKVVNTYGNTLRDALFMALDKMPLPEMGGSGGYGIVSIHRNENLGRRADLDLLMEEVARTAQVTPLKFVLHPATREKLGASGWMSRLRAVPGRMDYPNFVKLLVGSAFLMTDGGSNQEEAAMIGLPTLLLRRTTERQDGLEESVFLSNLDRRQIRYFVATRAGKTWRFRRPNGESPSAHIVSALQSFAVSSE